MNDQKVILGIKDYFEQDFPTTLRVVYELGAKNVGGQDRSLTVLGQAHIDTHAHIKFASFYIPLESTEHLLYVCKGLFAFVPEVLSLTTPKHIVLPKTDKSRTGELYELIRDGKFFDIRLKPLEGGVFEAECFSAAPVVYIYAEADLSDEALASYLQMAKRYGLKMRYRGPKYATERLKKATPEAFVSHDSRDKEEIAGVLASGLAGKGYSVWYDDFSLKPGDRLRETIELGLKTCKKCILVLTPNFLSNKGWTAAEFNAIFTREILEGKGLVIPVWYGVTKEQIFDYSPTLVNVLGVHWDADNSDLSIRQIAKGLEAP